LSELAIVIPKGNPYVLGLATTLRSKIDTPSFITSYIDRIKSNDTVVALGSQVYEMFAQNDRTVIAAFVPYHGKAAHSSAPKNHFYIYSEPSPSQIHSFIAHNFTSSKIGYLYTEEFRGVSEELEREFKKSGNTLHTLMTDGDVFNSIRELIRNDIDIMLVSKNNAIYTSKNIRTVIEALTRKRIPVISTTKSLVRSGATTSITSDQQEILRLTAEVANQLSGPKYPVNRLPVHTPKINVDTNESMISLYRFNITSEDKK